MFSLRQYREPTHRLPDWLPWACLIAPGVVLQKDAVFQTTVAFRGPDLASSMDSELISATARLNNALKRLGSGWALFVEAQRFESNRYPAAQWPCPAAYLVDLERQQSFRNADAHFESSYYMTFTWKVPPDAHNRVAALFYDDAHERKDERSALLRELGHFQKSVAEIVDIMRGVFPAVAPLDDDQTLSYLHSTISTHRHPVKCPETPMYLDAFLPDVPFTPGDVPMLGDHFVPTCTIAGFPGTTLPGILDALNHLRTEYRWVTRYVAIDKAEAKSLLEKYRKQWWAKRKGLWTMIKEEASKQEAALIDNAAANKAADADAALQELGDDLVSFGYLTTTITVWDRDLEQARRKSQRVKEVIQSRGFTVKDETINSLHAWLGSLPGHAAPNVRRPIVNSLNLAHMMPVSSVWAGEETNRHLEQVSGVGSPHVYCSTTGDTPFRLHLAVGDVGHTLILGPTGAGKSTLLGTLALQWLRYPAAQVIIFDKDRSARAATLAVGGACYEPGHERAQVGFQPLARIDEPAERVWAAQFVATMLAAQSVAVDHAAKAAIDATLANLATASRSQRTMTTLVGHLGSYRRSLGEALRPYTLEGNYGSIFDADQDDVDRASWTMIEMGHLMGMGEAVLIPALEYLFHRVEGQFDGRPTLMVIDEAWLFLGHPVFAGRLQAWLKTLRKKNVYVVFATQEVADATRRPELLATILSACHTKIFLPDEEALTPAMAEAYQRIGLTTAETTLLAKAQKKRDYYYRSVLGRRLFQLGLGPATLAFVGMASEADHKFLDTMIATRPANEYGRAMLERRGVGWAIDAWDRTAASISPAPDAAAIDEVEEHTEVTHRVGAGRPPARERLDEGPPVSDEFVTREVPAPDDDNVQTRELPAPDDLSTLELTDAAWERLMAPAAGDDEVTRELTGEECRRLLAPARSASTAGAGRRTA